MKVNSKTQRERAREFIGIRMAADMKEIGKAGKKKVLAFICTPMA